MHRRHEDDRARYVLAEMASEVVRFLAIADEAEA
jgi:hypothetical protein